MIIYVIVLTLMTAAFCGGYFVRLVHEVLKEADEEERRRLDFTCTWDLEDERPEHDWQEGKVIPFPGRR